jgi:hypothetical protein
MRQSIIRLALAIVTGLLGTAAAARATVVPSVHGGRAVVTRSRPTAVRAYMSSAPVFIAGSYRGRRPANIGISGDGGNIVTHLHWSQWASARAAAIGTSDIQGCVPNCAEGTERSVRTSIELLDPRHGYFTTLVERRAGHTEVFLYTPGHRPDNWPGDAS